MNILVVDDEKSVLELIKDVLHEYNYTVDMVADGNTCLQMCHEHPYDLIIIDILLPDVDGCEIIKTLKKEYAHTKIIAISGGGQIDATHYLRLARMLGADHVLMKPFAIDALLFMVAFVEDELNNAA